jgi:sec-independent protein translocase protein TatA
VPNIGGWELIILLGVVVLIFGAKKLPDMARSVGQSARVFKGEMKGLTEATRDASAPPADNQSQPAR